MDACGWNGGTHQDRIRRSLNRMQELISRLTSSCYALWKGSLESPTSSTSQKSVCVSRPVVPAPFLSFCSCCEPSFSEKSCPFRPRFAQLPSCFQPLVRSPRVWTARISPPFAQANLQGEGFEDRKKKGDFRCEGIAGGPVKKGHLVPYTRDFLAIFFVL